MVEIRKMFWFLSIMNLFDASATFLGVHYGWIEEYNPLMIILVNEKPWLFLLIKGSLSLILILISYYWKGMSVSLFIKILTSFSILLYTAVSIAHFIWICYLI